jgi:hypothetical protein
MRPVTRNDITVTDNSFRIPEIRLLSMKWHGLHTNSWHNNIVYWKPAAIISQGRTQPEAGQKDSSRIRFSDQGIYISPRKSGFASCEMFPWL